MPEINKQQAKEFLNKISKKDKVAIIHHDDADGFCSGILLNNYLKKNKIKTKIFSYSLNKTSLTKLPLKKFNKIIITDVSTKAIEKEIKTLKQKQILYIDHHPKSPLPSSVKYLITPENKYIPASRIVYEITKGHQFISIIGTIADSGHLYKENQKFIKNFLKKQYIEKFNQNYTYPYSDTIIYFNKNPKKAFKKLSKIHSLEQIKNLKKYSNKIEKDIQKTLKKAKKSREKINNINIYQANPKYSIKGIISSKLAEKSPNEIHIILSQKESSKSLLGLSSRHQSTKANLPKLLEAATKNLPDSNFGGHKRASGGQIRKKDLEKFKQNLKNFSKK